MKTPVCPVVAIVAIMLSSALTLPAAAQDAVQWTEAEGGNGHWYARAEFANQDYEGLISYAQSLGGHLASITSAEENIFLSGISADLPDSTLLGARDENPSPDICEWTWADGSEWNYTNWAADQPNSCGGEEYVAYYSVASESREWHDMGLNNGSIRWFLIEWSADCNGDGIVDYGQMLEGTIPDDNGNNIPDTCDALDLNGDGSLDAEQLMVALPRLIGSGQALGDVSVDSTGVIFAGNADNNEGSIFRIVGLDGLNSYGPSLTDPDTVCVNEGPVFDGYPETTILIGREDRITALNTDGSTADLLIGGSELDNVNALHIGADGKLGWVALTPNPVKRSTLSDGSINTINLLVLPLRHQRCPGTNLVPRGNEHCSQRWQPRNGSRGCCQLRAAG